MSLSDNLVISLWAISVDDESLVFYIPFYII